MTEQTQLKLRDLLLEMRSNAAPETVDEIVRGLVEARFRAGDAVLSEAVQERHLAAIRAQLQEGPTPEPSWIAALLMRPWRLAIPVVAILVVVGLVLLLSNHRAPIANGPNHPAPNQAPLPQRGPKRGEIVNKTPHQEPESPVPQKHPNKPGMKRTAPHGGSNLPRQADIVARKVEIGKASAVVGRPTITPDGQRMRTTVQPGDRLFAASVIETGDADKLDLVFNDGTSIYLDFDTSITLLGGSSDSIKRLRRPEEIRITKGRIVAKVVHAADNSPFSVRTPVATAEDVGTIFSLSLEKPEKPTEALKAVLQVKEGKVAFYNGHGRVLAGALTESTAIESAAPTEPKRIQSFLLHIPGSELTIMVGSGVPDERGASQLEAYALGWAGLDVSSQSNGELGAARVWPGSPAGTAGLKTGDIIAGLDGRPVAKAIDVDRAIYRHPRTKMRFEIKRGDRRETVVLTTEKRLSATLPSDPRVARTLRELTDQTLTGPRASARHGLEALIVKSPNAPAYNNLGVLHQMDDRLGDAIRCFQAAVRLDPTCALYHSNLGQALNLTGNTDRALAELRAGADLDQTGWERESDLAESLNLAGRPDEALTAVEKAIRRNPGSAVAWATKSEILSDLGKGEEAIVAAKHAAAIEPSIVVFWTTLAKASMLAGDNVQAESSFRKALELSATDMGALNDYASLLNRLGRLADSEKMFRKLTEVAPGFGTGWDNLSVILVRLGRREDAEVAARKAIAIDSRDAFAHTNLAKILSDAGRLEEAVVEARKAVASSPDLPNLHYTLGSILAHRHHFAEAEAELTKAIAIDPKFVQPHPLLGNVYEAQKRFYAAEAEYRATIALAPQHALGYTNLGLLLASRNRTAEAEKALRKAVEVGPNLVGPHQDLAQFLADSRRYDEAEAELKRVVELAGPNKKLAAEAYVRLGVLYEKKLDTPAALAAYRRTAELDAGNKRAQEALKRLGS